MGRRWHGRRREARTSDQGVQEGKGFILSSCSLSASVSQCSTTGCLNNAAAICLVSAHVYLIESLPQTV